MSELEDLKRENAQLKTQLKFMTDKIDSVLEIAHKLRFHISGLSGYAKLIRKHTLDPEVLQAASDQIESHSKDATTLIESLQSRGYET